MEKNTRNVWQSLGSIQGMRLENFVREACWLAVLAICCFVIQSTVTEQYSLIGSEWSIRYFQSSIIYGTVYMAILTILWWMGTTNEWDQGAAVRNFFEQYTVVCSLIFDVLACVGIVLIYFFCGGHGIYAPNGYPYPLNCIYMLPAVFISAMYALPPVNVKNVIVRGEGRRYLLYRILLSVIAAVVAVGVFMFDFFEIG